MSYRIAHDDPNLAAKLRNEDLVDPDFLFYFAGEEVGVARAFRRHTLHHPPDPAKVAAALAAFRAYEAEIIRRLDVLRALAAPEDAGQ